MNKNNNIPKANKEIKADQVRLIDENGKMLGIMSFKDALDRAREVTLDLVEISPNSDPPVCKILNFGKFKYENKKRIQDAKKKQKVVTIKEMKFKFNISQGDFDIKLRKIKDFLQEGDKVKVSLWFKGREIIHNNIGMKLFERISLALKDFAKVDSIPKMEGKQITMMLSPAICTIN